MWGYHDSMTWWWMIPMAAFWVSLVWLAIWGTKMFSDGRRESLVTVETPLEIAQARLARGEISKEEYDELRSWLR